MYCDTTGMYGLAPNPGTAINIDITYLRIIYNVYILEWITIIIVW